MPSPEEILTFFKERAVHPATARELARMLRVPSDERVAFKRDLKRFVISGQLVQIRGNRFGLPDEENLLSGRLQTNPAGFGFVVPDAESERNESPETDATSTLRPRTSPKPCTAIGCSFASNARRLAASKGASSGCSNGRTTLSWDASRRMRQDWRMSFRLIAASRRTFTSPRGRPSSAEPNEMVVVQITRWPTATRGPVGRVVEVLGNIDEPGVDTQHHHSQAQHSGCALARRPSRRRGGSAQR